MEKTMKKDAPKISVVTIVFNDAIGIEETIKSIIGQTYSNIEYILIDGKSTDGTVEIINKYSQNIDVLISEPDKGIYDAKNKGIDNATGEWIIFMNSGDLFYSNETVEKVAPYLTADVNVVYGDALLSYNYTQNKIYRKAKEFHNVIYAIPFCHQSVFVKTENMREEKLDLNLKCTSDYDFFLKLYKKKKDRSRRLSIPICIYDMHGVSNSETMAKEYYKISKRYYPNSFISFYHLLRIYRINFKKGLKKVLPTSVVEKIIKYKRDRNWSI